MATSPIRVFGIAWYRIDDFTKIRAIMVDRDKIAPTFSQWRMAAEQGEKKLRRQGHITVKAYIDPDTFPDWCEARGLDVDAKARMEFANAVAKEHAGSTH